VPRSRVAMHALIELGGGAAICSISLRLRARALLATKIFQSALPVCEEFNPGGNNFGANSAPPPP